jgi:hypothetical protein
MGMVVGLLTGAGLAIFWWDFYPEDPDLVWEFIVPLYAVIGAGIGAAAATILVAVAAGVAYAHRRLQRRVADARSR